MAATEFDPNRFKLQRCIDRIQNVVERTGFRADYGVITSKDEAVRELVGPLETDNVPEGFKKWQLPVHLDGASVMFVTVAQPGAKAPPHSHDEGAGIRFIAGGSINYEGRELSAGDWMYIPAGQRYSFEVGSYGAVMCYCYQC